MKRRLHAVVAVGCLLAQFAGAQPATITVTNSADAGPGTLRQAIADSASGDTITFAIQDTNLIALTSGQLLITNNLTIVSSNAPVAIDAGGTSRVLEIASSNTVVLNSLILTNGNVFDIGGGILVDEGAAVTLTNCTVAGNVADAGGGIFISASGLVAIQNSVFSANSATNNGGAIANDTSGTLTIDNSTFTGNSAARGGAIFNHFGTNFLTNCAFSGNAAQNGGAIANFDSLLIAASVNVSSNFAAAGGGIFNLNTNGILTLSDSTISSNFATNYGGGILNTNGGTATINNSTISSNACPSDQGGGVDNWSTITLNNCTVMGSPSGGGFVNSGGIAVCNSSTFSKNFALFDGGGFYGFFGTNILNNCTISGNSARRRAGGLYENSTVSLLTNTIVAGNTALISDPEILGFISVANSLTNGNPLLAPLGDYGGPTQTMPPLAGSPAINAGADSVTNLFTIDQRGYARRAGSHVDIGAVEIQPAIVINSDDDGPGSLRAAVASAPILITFTNTLSGQTIHLTNGQITLSNSVIVDASGLGSGVLIDAGGNSRVLEIAANNSVTLDSLTITHGNVTNNGGGILVNDGVTLMLTNCTVAGNNAGAGGGVFISTNSAAVIGNSTFFNNAATNNGGGFFAAARSQAMLNNCTFFGNSGSNGGGIAIDANVTNLLNNCTITGNSANIGGGLFQDFGSISLLTNTIVAGNTATSNSEIFGAIDGANNLTNGNPLLAPLGNYGGFTQTMPPLAGSPAIDAGLDSDTSLATDQRGYPRQSGAHVDIGAVEAQLWPANNRPLLRLSRTQPGGGWTLTFTNTPTADFTVLSSTNLALPLNQWTLLGPLIQNPPGLYQFTDLSATNSQARFYQVISP